MSKNKEMDNAVDSKNYYKTEIETRKDTNTWVKKNQSWNNKTESTTSIKPVPDKKQVNDASRELQWSGVTTTVVNARIYAGIEYDVCKFSPLGKGVKVDVCDNVFAKDGSLWYYIFYNGNYGFVSSKYITKL